jgi:transcriptional regulator GlxA family with amidase domain
MQLVAAVLSRLQRAAQPADDPHVQLIAHARAVIESQWQQSLEMKELSAALRMSYRHFRRLFQQHTGLPPNQFLLNLRINRAKQLLEESLTIEEVAYRCGFADPYYFSRLFKQKTGITPAKWRG